jgi:hypothetical protein
VQNLKERLMPVRPDLPVVALAAFADGFAVEPVRRLRSSMFAIQRIGGQVRGWR